MKLKHSLIFRRCGRQTHLIVYLVALELGTSTNKQMWKDEIHLSTLFIPSHSNPVMANCELEIANH